jgi:hypothetical protein
MALALDQKMALVSPQFHITFDPSFHTVKQDTFDSQWHLKAGFVGQIQRLSLPTKQLAQPANKKQNVKWNPQTGGVETPSSKRKRSEIDHIHNMDTKQLHQLDTSPDNDLIGIEPTKPPEKEQEPVESLIKAMMTEIKAQMAHNIEGKIFCLEAMFPYRAEETHPLMAFKATSDPDAMYLHEAIKEPDKKEFVEAMRKEVRDQSKNGKFTVTHQSKLPTNATVLPAVWQMKRKRNIRTRKVKKYKARLNIDGSRMQNGVHLQQFTDGTQDKWITYWHFLKLLLSERYT